MKKYIDIEEAVIDTDEIILITNAVSSPVSSIVSKAKKENKYLKLTYGLATNSYIILKDGTVIGTAYFIDELRNRVKEV